MFIFSTYGRLFLRGDMDGEVRIFEELMLVCEPDPAPDIDNAANIIQDCINALKTPQSTII